MANRTTKALILPPSRAFETTEHRIPTHSQAIEIIEDPTPTHESQIPPIAPKLNKQLLSTPNPPTHTTLSFAFPTSLAFFKRLAWDLTPWTHTLSPTTAATISAHFPSLPPPVIARALRLGFAFKDSSHGPKHDRPHLYVLFPHLHRPLPKDDDPLGDHPRNDAFLRSWHTDMIKPAYDEAWIASGLVKVKKESNENGTVWSTIRAAPSFDQVCRRFYETEYPWRKRPQHVEWPFGSDGWAAVSQGQAGTRVLAKGLEGRYSDERVKIIGGAWDAVKGMIRGSGEVGEMSDMVLMAVWEKEVQSEGAEVLVKEVGSQWDGFVDSRFVEEGMFFVDFGRNVEGEEQEEEQEEEGEEEDVPVKVSQQMGHEWLEMMLNIVCE